MKSTIHAALTVVLAFSPLALSAQSLENRADTSAVEQSEASLNLLLREGAIAGINVHRASRDSMPAAPVLMQDAPPTGTSRLLMVVGGAAFVGGLLIGDDAGTAIAVAGLGIGIYGLYLYLR